MESHAPGTGSDLATRYETVRNASHELTAPLAPEDCTPQSMTDASPVKWHLAHTSWFFETFVLAPTVAGYRAFDPSYRVLFNSYYNAVGEQYARPDRGFITRPGLAEVWRYREHVDDALLRLLAAGVDDALARVIELGLQHEQQHQELIVTDVKHLLAKNPLRPVYREARSAGESAIPRIAWKALQGGQYEVGHDGPDFCFDNETPRHGVSLIDFALAKRLVTNGEYIAFMDDSGYERPELWLSEGWARVLEAGWDAPLYWERDDDGNWGHYTLGGFRAVHPDEPVSHVSLYEADAYASWAGARLPTEFEWEVAAASEPVKGNFVESERFHPVPLATGDAQDGPSQLFGDVWEWTRSAYDPYPGYDPPTGALGEYNGKFMCSQLVLRGGSCATPNGHARASYRNFFYPDARWQFSGIRLARDA